MYVMLIARGRLLRLPRSRNRDTRAGAFRGAGSLFFTRRWVLKRQRKERPVPAGMGCYSAISLIDGANDGGVALAARALAGEPILVLPYGQHHRETWFGDTVVFDVTEEVVDAAVANYQLRESRGVRQRHLPVNEGHDMTGPARGWFTDVLKVDGGLGARFRWTEKGREALEGDEFAYMSLEFAWAFTDRVTGEEIHNQVIGAALVNYPFFGQEAALHSRTINFEGGTEMPGNGEGNDRTWLEQQFKMLGDRLTELFDRGDGGGTGEANVDALVAQALGPVQEQIAAFQSQIAALQNERDAAVARVETLSTQVVAVNEARATERYAVMAESFAHLPRGENFGAHLRWLHEADATEGAAHAAYFMDLLRRADGVFAEGFRRHAKLNVGMGSATVQVDARVEQYQAQHPDASYRDAVSAVLAADSALAEAWRAEQAHGQTG